MKEDRPTNTLMKDLEFSKLIRYKYYEHICRVAKIVYSTSNYSRYIHFDELINIGIMVIFENNRKSITNSYIKTALKWRMLREVENKKRWYKLLDKGYTNEGYTDDEKLLKVPDFRRTPEELCENLLLTETLENYIYKLPKKDQNLVISKFFQNKTLDTISKEENLSSGGISKKLKSCLIKMREAFKDFY